MVIIITAAIAPKSSVKQLVLRDPKERLDQYISALEPDMNTLSGSARSGMS